MSESALALAGATAVSRETRAAAASRPMVSHDHPLLPPTTRANHVALFHKLASAKGALLRGRVQILPLGTAPRLAGATQLVPFFAPQLQLVAASGCKLYVWNGETTSKLHEFKYPITALGLCRDDRDHQRLVAIADGGVEAWVWDLTEPSAGPIQIVKDAEVAPHKALWPRKFSFLRDGFALSGKTATARFTWNQGRPDLTEFVLGSKGAVFTHRGTPHFTRDGHVWDLEMDEVDDTLLPPKEEEVEAGQWLLHPEHGPTILTLDDTGHLQLITAATD